METDFKVRVGEFEGPLEVLLELIEKRKLHISSVSLSEVADEFIEYTRLYENFPIKDSADFILIASTLLLIKSRSLLPNIDLSEAEEGSIEDLENRLILYRRYKDLSFEIQKMFGDFLFLANERKSVYTVFAPTKEITLETLRDALGNAFESVPTGQTKLPQIMVKKMVSLEEMISNLSERIEKSLKMSFKDFSGLGRADKVNVIVSFLAMLELVKQGAVRVSQEKHFEDINIETENVGVPTY